MTATPLHHVRTGTGSPVLLLHPAGLDLTHWADQIDALRGRHEVVACDLAGHGRSPMDGREMSFARQASDATTLLDALGLTASVHVVGISYGSMIAQHLALAEPGRVASLALIGSAGDFPEPVRQGMRDRARRLRENGMAAVIDETMSRWFTDGTRRGRPHVIERATRTLLGDDAEAHALVWDTVSTHDTTGRLEEIRCPTLILVGESDPSTSPAAARRLGRRISGARLAVLPDASHMVTLEQPALISAHLAAFLGQTDAGRDDPAGG